MVTAHIDIRHGKHDTTMQHRNVPRQNQGADTRTRPYIPFADKTFDDPTRHTKGKPRFLGKLLYRGNGIARLYAAKGYFLFYECTHRVRTRRVAILYKMKPLQESHLMFHLLLMNHLSHRKRF
jgi:hypothetical protein